MFASSLSGGSTAPLTTSVSNPPPTNTANATANPSTTNPSTPTTTASSPPARSSRLRGFSYLRNYTQQHILSRDPRDREAPALARSVTQGSTTQNTANHNSSNSNHNNSNSNSNSNSNTQRTVAENSEFPSSDSPHSPHSPTNPTHLAPAHARSHHPSHPSPSSLHHRSQSQTMPESSSVPSSQSQQQRPNSDQNLSTSSYASMASPPVNPADVAPSLSTTIPEETRPANVTVSHGVAATTAATSGNSPPPGASLPSIRFSPYNDPRSARPSLSFAPVSRMLPTGTELIKVGRYTEREAPPATANSQPSNAAVGFKSKVVSRRHCEFWFENGKWYIKDVKSSSGTFLNHIRLSLPNTESRPFVVNDGDIIQLGIDFKGGEEMIFRCVKMRVELNRDWQTKPNPFNVQTHKRLRNLGSGESSQDCSICLNPIAPCQSLFVAPCSHTWHFKCVRILLESSAYPNFVCPNCRASADLEADVDEVTDDWNQYDEAVDQAAAADGADGNEESVQSPLLETTAQTTPAQTTPTVHHHPRGQVDQSSDLDSAAALPDIANTTVIGEAAPSPPLPHRFTPFARSLGYGGGELPDDLEETTVLSEYSGAAGLSPLANAQTLTQQPSDFPPSSSLPIRQAASQQQHRQPSPLGPENPLTPPNNVGPWVFDGRPHPAVSSVAQEQS